ncbi:MAG TPA: methyltransferase domain-containing protein [Pyrinomonadaceae bacterium]|nr:methyltransferase domain-containing protein [Pyrinomonadaceae bacterium]
MTDLKTSYDRVAARYAEEYFGELERKPDDRKLLDDFAELMRDKGEVCEIGCGPGQVARYLKDRGVNMCGIDLSEEMVTAATRLNPDIPFSTGNMLALSRPDDVFAGIVSFYAIIHIKRAEVIDALREMSRVLQPGGYLLITFHSGEGELHRGEWYGQPVSIDVTLFSSEEMKGYCEAAGLEVDRVVERAPYEFEYPTTRVYIQARKPL